MFGYYFVAFIRCPQTLTSFTRESPSIFVTGNFFCVLFFLFKFISFTLFLLIICFRLSLVFTEACFLGGKWLTSVTITLSFLSDISYSLRDSYLFDRANLGLDWLWQFLLLTCRFWNWKSSSASPGVNLVLPLCNLPSRQLHFQI